MGTGDLHNPIGGFSKPLFVRARPDSFTNVVGLGASDQRFGAIGVNSGSEAFGFIAGNDLEFHQHVGIYGESTQQGVMGLTTRESGTGVYGGHTSGVNNGIGIRGETSGGVGVQGRCFGSGLAGKFIGDVEVTGDIRLANADCAEDFDSIDDESTIPGTVMAIDRGGLLKPSNIAYDKRVAGVISGAGGYKPGMILDRKTMKGNRVPIALLGKVFCKVDAQYFPIEVGDLLTTSPTLGHAMRADDPFKAFGSVIGKALQSWRTGQGLIPILVTLQ